VLIPRPETEHVIEAVLELQTPDLRRQTSAGTEEGSRSEVRGLRSVVRIVDVGTGSGAIALALAKELPDAEILATDISSAALEIARANAARHQLSSRIRFHQADLLERLGSNFDFVVSNPPYVGESEADQVQMEVRKFEPRNAVFAGPTGVEVIERLIPQAYAALRPGGWLVMEVSGTIAKNVVNLLQGWDDVHVRLDLQSIQRVVQARRIRG
jgi:release factor glutamine methyltransferase